MSLLTKYRVRTKVKKEFEGTNVSFVVDASDTASTHALTLTLGAVLTSRSTQSDKNKNYIFSIPNDVTVPVDSDGFGTFYNRSI